MMLCVTKITVFLSTVPDPHQLEAELLARHGVKRRERLVHQQHRRVMNERAADRNALLHAAGKFARIALFEAAEPDELDQLERALARFALVEAKDFSRQQHVVEHGAPLQQHGLLKHDADVTVSAAAAARRHSAACRARA